MRGDVHATEDGRPLPARGVVRDPLPQTPGSRTVKAGRGGPRSFVLAAGGRADYAFEWALADGDTITSHTVHVTGGDGALAATAVADGRRVVVWLSGGTAGVDYLVTCHIVTAADRRGHRSMRVKSRNR